MRSRVDLASRLHALLKQSHEDCIQYSMCICLRMSSRVLCSLEVTCVVATDTRRSQLLDQDTDHIDEDDEVHLHGQVKEAPPRYLSEICSHFYHIKSAVQGEKQKARVNQPLTQNYYTGLEILHVSPKPLNHLTSLEHSPKRLH